MRIQPAIRATIAILIGVWPAAATLAEAPAGEGPRSGATADPLVVEVAPRTVREDVFPKTTAQFPGGIVAQPDVEYSNLIGYRPLQLDLYTHDEPGGARARPLVVWIHGGGWSRGDSRTGTAYANFPAVLATLAARGYVVASVNYRLSGEARFPAAIQDVKAAIRYLRTNAARFGIDPNKVVVWGGSAGGHLAALAATTCGLASLEPPRSNGRLPRAAAKTGARADSVLRVTNNESAVSDCVQGAVIWFGIFDLSSSSPATVSEFLGCQPRSCPERSTLASPIAHVAPSDPPMLLIHGTADTTAPPRQSEEMAARLRKVGAPVETLFIPGVAHGLIGENAAATRHASLLALRRTFDFIDAITSR